MALTSLLAAGLFRGPGASAGSLPFDLRALVPRLICALAPTGSASCGARILTTNGVTPFVTAGPSGYGPADFQSAYGLAPAAAIAGATQTVAVIEAFHDPSAATDLATYRSAYGLPPCGPGCFRQVDQDGTTTFAQGTNQGWAEEESLDVDVVSATCPRCNILVVEANNVGLGDMLSAVTEAASLGATEISNSWGGGEFPGQTGGAYDGVLAGIHGIPITASSGDASSDLLWPAMSSAVTAVGGTTLSRASTSRGWSETAWSNAGGGCSGYDARPAWQKGVAGDSCSNRAAADVSADADPATGASVYDSVGASGTGGWFVVGGTSLAAPLIAAVYALAGNGASVLAGSYAYGHLSSLHNLTPASSAASPSPPGVGGQLGNLLGNLLGCLLGCPPPVWSAQVGLGSPNGSGAF